LERVTIAGIDSHEQHLPVGWVACFAELGGRTGLSGADSSRTTAEFLVGMSYTFSRRAAVRAGLQFPLFKPREFDNAYLLGLVYHF
jgi:hypothetical protein